MPSLLLQLRSHVLAAYTTSMYALDSMYDEHGLTGSLRTESSSTTSLAVSVVPGYMRSIRSEGQAVSLVV